MRKIIIALIITVAALVTISAQDRMTTTAVNLRAESNTNSSVLNVIPAGTAVYVLDDMPDGWSLVVSDYQVGYIYSIYLKSYLPFLDKDIHYYINSEGHKVQSPTVYPYIPKGATARCVDGTYSFSKNRRGTCSHHGGVAQWL